MALLLFASAAHAQEVEIWTWWDFTEEDIAEFEAVAGATVIPRNIPWGDFQEKLIVGVLGGAGPDLIFVDNQWFDDFATKGTLTDLTPFMERNPTNLPLDDIFPAAYQLWQLDGKQLAMPNSASPSLWWYNRTMFRELGLPDLDETFDWDQWFEYARIASRDIDGDGVDDRKGLMDWWSDIANLIWSNGGEIFIDGQIAIDSPASREAVDFYAEFFRRELVASWEELAHVGFAQIPDQAWNAGYIAFAPGGDWVGPITVRDPNTNEWRFDVGVAHVPLAPSGGRVGLLRGNGLAIPMGAKNPEAAWRIIAHLLDDDRQALQANDGQMPARISIAASNEYLPDGQYPYDKGTIIASMAYQRPSDPGVLWSNTYAIWNSPIKDELSRFYRNEASLAEIMENITLRVTNMLREAAAQ